MQNLHYKRSFNFELFSLKIVHRRVSTYLSMKLFTEVINTKDLPNTKRILKTIPGTHWNQEHGLNPYQYIVPGAGGLGEILNNAFV